MEMQTKRMYPKNHERVEVSLSHWIQDQDTPDEVLRSIMVVESGHARMQFRLSPDEARKLAELLNQHADEVDDLALERGLYMPERAA